MFVKMGTTIPSSRLQAAGLSNGVSLKKGETSREGWRESSKLKKRRMIMNIYVGNLSYDATDVTIREAFESFGEVTSARVIKDKYTGQSRGFGFVEMSIQSQAQTAIKSLNGKDLLGKQISVNEARARADQGRTGGGRMDYSGRGNRY
jgi:RNA recognition motif-containing protein